MESYRGYSIESSTRMEPLGIKEGFDVFCDISELGLIGRHAYCGWAPTIRAARRLVDKIECGVKLPTLDKEVSLNG